MFIHSYCIVSKDFHRSLNDLQDWELSRKGNDIFFSIISIGLNLPSFVNPINFQIILLWFVLTQLLKNLNIDMVKATKHVNYPNERHVRSVFLTGCVSV